MNDFADAFYTAVSLIGHFDPELRQIVSLSLGVSLTASFCAFLIGTPLGAALAMYCFRGKGALIVIANALLGLPPVVVGLLVYLLLSRSGPLGLFGILFTPTAMVIAQAGLGLPIVVALVHRMTVDNWATYGDALLVDGASRLRAMIPIMLIGREGLLTAFLAEKTSLVLPSELPSWLMAVAIGAILGSWLGAKRLPSWALCYILSTLLLVGGLWMLVGE
jgi:tungstate transport system permease protein